MITHIKNRDGRTIPFDIRRINDAIEKSFAATEPGVNRKQTAIDLALEVYTLLDLEANPAPELEHIQDVVEQVLMRAGHTQVAKNYILYRQERSRLRRSGKENAGASDWKTLLSDCKNTGDAVMTVVLALREHPASSVADFPEAMTPAVSGSFRAAYRRAQRLSLELLTGIRVHEKTQFSWAAGLEQKGLSVTLAGDKAALSREADLICGTLGCDREPVCKAQEISLQAAAEETEQTVREAISRLCAATGLSFRDLQGTDENPEAMLVAKALR